MNFSKEIQSCGIIGAGMLGTSLAEALSSAGLLKWIIARSDDSLRRISPLIAGSETKVYSMINEVEDIPDLIFILVNDSNIEHVSEELAEHLQSRIKKFHRDSLE